MSRVRRYPRWEPKRHEPRLVVHHDGWWGLTDGQVLLTPTEDQDIRGIATACADAHARKMLAHWAEFPAGPAAARQEAVRTELFHGWRQPSIVFTVFANGAVVGTRFLWYTSQTKHDGGSCGGWVHPTVRGTGVNTTALRLAAHHYARNVGGDAITTGTREDNVAAQRSLASAGFTKTGTELAHPRLGMWRLDLAEVVALGPMPVDQALPFQTHALELIMGARRRPRDRP